MSSNRFDRFEYYECLRQQDTLLDEAIARRRLADCPHGPFEHRLGLDGYLYIGARVRRVREAVAESQSFALRELQAKLGGIGLADVWPILREICHDVALYVGGGAIVGGAIGGGLGVFAFGAGALPGAAAGAALGTQAGNLLLGFFGLKSVVVFMLDSLPRATRAYRQGFFEAWGGMPDLGAHSLDAPHYGVDRLADSTYLAARAFARGHEILILALLAGVVAYLTRGKGQLSALLAEVRQSARLGPKMTSWLEQNEGKLLSHPLLNERARGNGGGAIGGGAEVGASASGPRTGNQTTTGAAPRDSTLAVGEAERKVSLGGKNVLGSPVDIAHAIGADYTKAGRPTGGHSLLNGDVRILPGTESVPDASGVYKATIQVPDPQNPGQWLTKTSNASMNSMFPKNWDASRIQSEVDAAWNSPNRVVSGNKWSSFTPSGVKVEGYVSPRTTVYPVHQP
ncbi:EndoU domain-containing protein [Rugamonas rubra]|uniref:EndoU nuclease n=1 Tax=Rugamonas rubra TaxID=758825 RepID=A0A1I4SFJ3_9BURK|nr:EndoU domain-containing protein [Rugamonas rubra]SFM63091.1 EndoU nuclease [Rugamonas rubra]